ncbi:hypothetical protein ASPZODRAFT_152130 [Penicilliopsis zonata CBS 506.65]|uniref:Thioredoxin domain-containing protein n=1 Tax=Penicilliopsis zonata CBS 506.65 TaxID=1073090 RepID=A0A1L9SHJ7_9EURO|nr:hypothetical protein ASPZODRAFT_152130 [Penicilliopsis zonata CBS 506.65]OJJ46689.1 hypothetical protein ASPZODRAFT_152130 [Penicilliopsis zonata CBS 506.65]
MRATWLAWSFLSLLAVPAVAVPFEDTLPRSDASDSHRLVKRDEVPDVGSTTFNGIAVPALRELTPDDFDETIKNGYWFVKHYSPACPHCKKIAPAWQTLYEFYYTSNPLSSSSSKPSEPQSLNSFQNYYDFNFASLNCLAFADLCRRLDIREFPRFSVYHNGELEAVYTGKKTMQGLGDFVEETLESIKPGSRPLVGLKYPEPGVTEFDLSIEPAFPGDKVPLATQAAVAKASVQTPSPKGKALPNPQGMSVPLTAESFQRLVTTTRDPWFVKFYAPWCGHCQALAPTWSQMAKEMKGVLNVGEVNCEVETRLCKDARIQGYPTMYFFRGGERVEYNGLRGLGDLLSYAHKAVDIGSGVQDVDAATFKEMEEKEEVLFLYLYDHATVSEDFTALERLTLSLVGHAKIVKSDDPALAERFKISTWPRLLVVRDGRPNYYNALAPKDMRDYRQVLNWMRSVWLPIVPEVTASNAKEIMGGKYVVLGVLSRKRSDDFIQAKRELKNAALEWMDKQTQLFQLERQELRDSKQLRIEEAEDRNDQRALRAAKGMRITIREDDKKQVAFAWIDGDFWERWLRTTYGIDVEHGERVIINDEDNRRYWDTSSSGASIMASRTSILETIPLVIADSPKLSPKSTIGTFESAFFFTRSFIFNHPFIFMVLLFISIAAASMAARGKLLKRGAFGRGGILGNNGGVGFFHLDGKEGLLNGGATGKVD